MARLFYGACLVAVGVILTCGGAWLIWLSGSPYYLAAGIAVAIAGLSVLRRGWRTASIVYLAFIAATTAWALAESGLDGWALMPRLLSPFVLGLPFLLAALIRGRRAERLGGLAVVFAAALIVALAWMHAGFAADATEAKAEVASTGTDAGDWPNFGFGQDGRRHSPLGQIGPGNVGKLERLWSVSFGPMPSQPHAQHEAVPLKIGDHLYLCTAFNEVIELDPETGKVRWRHKPLRDDAGMFMTKCRGLTYFAPPAASGACSHRIYSVVSDGQLIALDARTGRLCPGFGTGGRVDLRRGLRQRNPGYYFITSPPALIDGKLVVGGSVADGQYVGEPSGVVRAYDAVTGKLAWAWDAGHPARDGEPPSGEAFTPGTPNAWGPMSADEQLGLVYVPTGNATPDYWGGHRSAASNEFASSVVALDARTGRPRWHFQTTHYDVWDYDVGSQPVLFDLRMGGRVVPALIQPTKRGQLFILDRRTGKPLFPVEERPAPQAGAVERLSPTQPWSVALPNLGGPRLAESSMWGITAIDQLWCRISFRQARYEGSLTPPGTSPSIADPGYIGGVNWASASIDTRRQLAFIASARLANHVRLIPRAEPKARALKASSTANQGGLVAQEGTPYAADIAPFLSPLGVPCQQPPHGMINAIDLATGKLAWSRPLGTARDLGPLGIKSGLPFTIGTPLLGGVLSTTSGVVFVGASRDHMLRAFDSESGKLLFEADLPGTADTVPMTYRSDRSGRQIVVISSSAPPRGGKIYSAVTAFALPAR